MKRFIVFVGLLIFLGMAYMTHSYLKQSDEDQEVIEWANSLVWAAIGSQSSVKFVEPKVAPDDEPEHWVVSGEISLRQGATAPLVHSYSARIARLCEADERRECWRLDELVIGGSDVDLTGLEPNYPSVIGGGTAGQVAGSQPAPAPLDGTGMGVTPGAAETAAPTAGLTAGLEPASATGAANGHDGMQQDGTQQQVTADGAAPAAVPEAAEVATLSSESAPDAASPAVSAEPAAAPTEAALSPEASARRQMIAEIQARLLDLGYDPGPVDGLMGPQTRTAIEGYQRKNEFTVDGEPSARLLQLLELQQ